MEQIGTALQMAKGFADAVLLKPLGELGGILSDTIGYWRLKNQVRLMVKAKEWLEQKKVDPAKVLPDIFVPILDEGSKVEDEQLSDMFASLLASHLDSKTQDRVHPSFPKVLSQLSPLDAREMVEFRKRASDKEYRSLGLRGGVLTVKMIAELLGMSEAQAYLSALNLHRLGIIQHVGYKPPAKHPMPTFFEDIAAHQEYRVSEYGIVFCDACHRFEDDTMAYYPKYDQRHVEPSA
ncbi:MAG: Abi-alpha family protein [Phycisphaerales bacterium]